MILWKSVSGGSVQRGPSAYIKHCEYEIRDITFETGQHEVRQYWTGKNTRIALKITRAPSLEAAKQQANEWDAAYDR